MANRVAWLSKRVKIGGQWFVRKPIVKPTGFVTDTPEWKAGIAKIAAGIPAGKAVRIVMSSETQQSIKNARIGFKRALMAFLKQQKLNYEVQLRGAELFVKNVAKR